MPAVVQRPGEQGGGVEVPGEGHLAQIQVKPTRRQRGGVALPGKGVHRHAHPQRPQRPGHSVRRPLAALVVAVHQQRQRQRLPAAVEQAVLLAAPIPRLGQQGGGLLHIKVQQGGHLPGVLPVEGGYGQAGRVGVAGQQGLDDPRPVHRPGDRPAHQRRLARPAGAAHTHIQQGRGGVIAGLIAAGIPQGVRGGEPGGDGGNRPAVEGGDALVRAGHRREGDDGIGQGRRPAVAGICLEVQPLPRGLVLIIAGAQGRPLLLLQHDGHVQQGGQAAVRGGQRNDQGGVVRRPCPGHAGQPGGVGPRRPGGVEGRGGVVGGEGGAVGEHRAAF